jgi:threonine dehydratase
LEINDEDLYDEWCDPKNPRILRFEEIAAAAYRIKYGVEKTPCTVCILSLKFDSFLFDLYRVHICQE